MSPGQRPPGTAISPLTSVQIWISAALLLVAASFAFGLLVAAILGGTETLSDPERSPLLKHPTWIAVGTLVNELAAFAAFALWWFKLRPAKEVMPIRAPKPLDVLAALLLTFGVAPFAEAVGELVHRVVQNDVTASKVVIAAARGASDAELVLLLLCLAVAPAVVEEALFRGLITAGFRTLAAAIVVPSVLFGMFHLEPTQAAGTVLLGAAFGFARLCTDNLSVSMVAHGVYNAVVLLVVRFSTGPEDRALQAGPMIFGAALAAAGTAMLWRARKARLAEIGD